MRTTINTAAAPHMLCSLPRNTIALYSLACDAHTDRDWAFSRRCSEALRLRARRGDRAAFSAFLAVRQDRARARHLDACGLPMVPR